MEEYIKPKCLQCKSKQIYTTKKERVCRKCGFRETLVMEKKENEKENTENTETANGTRTA